MNPSLPKITVGSRGSKLALVQAEEVRSLLAKTGIKVDFELKTYATRGDRDKTVSLTTNPADDFFTDTLDAAVLAREIDVAVHSAKDLPQTLQEGLAIFALTAGVDETDAFIGKIPFDQLPAGAKVATSSLLRRQQVRELNPKLVTIDIRGTIEERITKMEEGYCDGLIVATAALKRLGLEKYIRNIMPWEAVPLQGQLAVVGRAGDTALRDVFAAIDVRRSYGRVFLVGAGPGDPELITRKGIRILETAQCVLYDYLIPQDLLAYASRAEKNYVGKRKGVQAMPQEELNKLLRQKAMAGKTVVRLKGGDPLVFGRGGDEIEYLRRYHIETEVIPGVSSATGIPSHLGIPLTARGVSSSVAFISGHKYDEEENRPTPLDIPTADTLIFLMGLTKLNQIVASLEIARWPKETPMMVISRGTWPQEKIVSGTLADIRQKVRETPLEPPVLIIVGETLKFYTPRPPNPRPKRILYTGTHPEKFRALGEIIPFPMIQIVPVEPQAIRLKTLLTDLPNYDIILFTSRFAVRYFMDLLKNEGCTLDLNTKSVVAIGHTTARELQEAGIREILRAATETSEGLFAELKEKFDLKGKKILFPRSALPNPYLKQKLTEEGSQVDELTMYENLKPARRPLPQEEMTDAVLFTSPSTVRNFIEDYEKIPAGWHIISRGPLTSACLREHGYTNFEEQQPPGDLC